MAPVCTTLCTTADKVKFPYKTDKRAVYINGFKRCHVCSISIVGVGTVLDRCPCCQNKLRTRPRKKMDKNRDDSKRY